MFRFFICLVFLPFSVLADTGLLLQHQRLADIQTDESQFSYALEAKSAPITPAPVLEPAPVPEPETDPKQESKLQPALEKNKNTAPRTFFIQGSVAPLAAAQRAEVVVEKGPEAEPEIVKPIAPLQINKATLSDKRATAPYSTYEKTASSVQINQDLFGLVHQALSWHPSIRQARSQILAGQEGIDAAKAAYYPQVRGGVNTGYRDSTGRENESFNVSASQLIYDFGKTASDVKFATHAFNKEQAGLLLNIDQLIEKTASGALELMRSQEKMFIANEQLEALDELLVLARDRAQMGASAQSDPIQALSRKEAATALIFELEAQNDIWQTQLQSLTGIKEQIHLSTDMPVDLSLQCQNHFLQLDHVPAYLIAEETRNSAVAQLDLSEANLYPTISAEAGYDQYLRSRDVLRNGRIQKRNSDFSFMLNVNMSLFEGGGKVARKNAAGYALQAADEEKESTVLEITRGFEESQRTQQRLNHRLNVLAARISSIEQAQDIYKQQYISLGTRSLLELLNTEEEIYKAKADYIDNKYEMYKAQVTCLYYGAQLRTVFDVSVKDNQRGLQ